MSYEQCARVIALRDEVSKRYKEFTETVQAQFEAECLAEVKAKYPRRKTLDFKKLWKRYRDLCMPIRDRYEKQIPLHYARLRKQRERLDKILSALVDSAELKPNTSVWTRLSEADTGDYRSVGFGADKYARHAVESSILHAQAHGIPAHLRVRQERYTHYPYIGYPKVEHGCTTYFEAWVALDKIGVEILRRKTVSVVEWVRNCWANGVNPRVYQPFLPYGFEEKHGIRMC